MDGFLLSPQIANIIARQQVDFFEKTLVPGAVPWDEAKTPFKENLCLIGETYRPDHLFQGVEPVPINQCHLQTNQVVASPCGRYLYCVRTLPRGKHLNLHQGRRHGRVYFTTDVHVPVLAEVTEFSPVPDTLMSMTPQEMISLRPGIREAQGTVLVGGLGMGWFLSRVCRRVEVERVIVVEKSQALMDWVRPALTRRYDDVARKVQDWICDDVYGQIGKHGSNVRHLIDIWPDYRDAVRDQEFQRLRNSINYLWGWGDVGGPD